MQQKPLKDRKCRVCRTSYQPRSTFQKVCGPRCLPTFLQKERHRKSAREKREGRERLRTKRDWVKLAQSVFNAFIRERDKHLPCISCHMESSYQGQWHASHYRSVGAAPELRFDEANVHKSCAQCNSHKSGNVVEYRIRLLQKIGAGEVERLEGPQTPRHYDIAALKAIRDEYRQRLRELRQ
jgi:hypothetical protein